MNNTETTITTTNTTTKAKTNKAELLKAASAKQVKTFLDTREKAGLTIACHTTKSLNLGDNYTARYVKILANRIRKIESLETGNPVTAAWVINEFRNNRFAEKHLSPARLRAYTRQLSKKAGFELSEEHVKSDLIRQSANIWKSGNFS